MRQGCVNFVFNVPVKTLFFYFFSNCQDCDGGGEAHVDEVESETCGHEEEQVDARERERERERI